AHLLFRFSLFLLPAPVPTALHPLSLHDALPISGRLASRLLSEQPLNLSGHASRRRRRRLTTKDRAVRVLHRARTREPGLRDRGSVINGLAVRPHLNGQVLTALGPNNVPEGPRASVLLKGQGECVVTLTTSRSLSKGHEITVRLRRGNLCPGNSVRAIQVVHQEHDMASVDIRHVKPSFLSVVPYQDVTSTEQVIAMAKVSPWNDSPPTIEIGRTVISIPTQLATAAVAGTSRSSKS